jgi:hypothetical protein
MWQKIARVILTNRLAILIGLFAVTIVMGYFATKVEMLYEFSKLLPENDPVSVTYTKFKKDFGQDGLAVVIATTNKDFYEKDKFQKWYELGNELQKIQVPLKGTEPQVFGNPVDSVFSEAHLYNIVKNNDEKLFEIKPLFDGFPSDQKTYDSLQQVIVNLPFYEDIVYKKGEDLHLMMLFLNREIFNSKNRGSLIQEIQKKTEEYAEELGPFVYSGLPYIRDVTMKKVKQELYIFTLLALLITSTLLYLFFKSFKVVIISMVVVIIGVVWSMGTIGLIGFKLTALMGLIPPLIIVIGIPNCVYLITKYQQEYKDHGNKVKALTRVIKKVGTATLMTNATTAMGFGTFIFTHSKLMQDFGVIASLNILLLFFVSILVVPIIYSYLSTPKIKHTKHLERKWLFTVVDKLVTWSSNHRSFVYVLTLIAFFVGIYGMSLMKTSGNIVDDLPKKDAVVQDLKFFESKLGGIMPFEIILESTDTIYNSYDNIRKIDDIQKTLALESKLSKSISIVDAIKFVTQSYSNGNPEKFVLKDKRGLSKILSSKYFKNTFNLDQVDTTNQMLNGFLDASKKQTRVTVQIADVGIDTMNAVVGRVSERIRKIVNEEQILVDSIIKVKDNKLKEALLVEVYEKYSWIKNDVMDAYIEKDPSFAEQFFDDESLAVNLYKKEDFEEVLNNTMNNHPKFSYSITGSAVNYTKGTTYLVNNLFISLALAIMVIALLMSVLFRSWKMVVVSLIPNLLPLIITSAIMGIFGIPIKPSTILVFSIAFGISVDDTIHFLAKYRQELTLNDWNIKKSVDTAIRETGVSMIYTSIILFFGFGVFTASNFGGTQALGILVSITLFVAMLANLVLLPSLLLTLEKRITNKSFKDPLLEVVDDEDIDINLLELKKEDNKDKE